MVCKNQAQHGFETTHLTTPPMVHHNKHLVTPEIQPSKLSEEAYAWDSSARFTLCFRPRWTHTLKVT
eukprot:5797001-Amphidinium_carterae.1